MFCTVFPRHLRCGIYTTKIDLRTEGTPQNEILQNEEQMRDFSDAIQKFHRNTNLGGNNKEDYDENHSMPRVPETHH